MLATEYIDYMFVVPEEIDEQIKASGMPKDLFMAVNVSDVTVGNLRYLMSSKNTDDEIIKKLNTAISP
ncbi:MAG: hypothetical protein ACKOAD_03600 [Gammaproteobacteria bacterium]